jgi:transcriptional regulator with PAS, ATPase and Fis domain
MEVIWLKSPNRCHSAASFVRRNVIVKDLAEFVDDDSPCRVSLAIVEIADAADVPRAAKVLDKLRMTAQVCIFDPQATVASSVSWMKAGAVHVATTAGEVGDQLDFRGRAQADLCTRRSSLLGCSAAVQKVDADIRLVAGRRCNLLIEGETGTGKEVVARETHAAGDRRRGPWVAVNCGAIPEALLEAELFGHVRGAFTGAVQSRAGKFEMANHGTIFLDEIGDMPLSIQAKLLRVLQEREVERLGGNERIKLDVRIIAATNVNLAKQVEAGLFRQDLYYRLNVFRILIPPLRARKDDIPVLAQHFVDRFCTAEQLPRKSLDSQSYSLLNAHSWPGNVRELENAMESAVIVSGARAVVLPSDIRINASASPAEPEKGPTVDLPPQGLDYQTALEHFESNLLTQALERSRGNKTAAADLLGLKRTTLSAKMRVLESRVPRLVA